MEYIDEGQARLEPFRFPKGYRGPDFSVWYVTSSGEFFPVSHRERPGVQLPFSGEFSFAGYRWLVPGVYSTAKALVVDLCREVPLQAIQDFIQKWNLTLENDDIDCFSKAQRMEMEAENPLELEVSPGSPVTVDNEHVVAWDASLDYSIRVASGTFGFTSGEGLVNEFNGNGKVYIQTRNIHNLADALRPFFPSNTSN